MDIFIQQMINGLTLGCVYAIVALGYTMVYGIIQLINFAHGEVVMIGAMVAFTVITTLAGAGMAPLAVVLIGLACAIPACMAVGYTVERLAYRPLRRAPRLAPLITAIGVSIILQHLAMLVWTRNVIAFPQIITTRIYTLGGAVITNVQIVIIALCVAIMAGLALLVYRTRLGTAVRAVTDNSDLAESSGIDVQRVILAVWIACGALAAAAGVLLGMTQTVEYDMGFKVLLVIFAAMILGGLGSAFGAMVGGALLGLVLELSTFWIPTDFKNAIALGMLIVVLLFRPQGILGVRERVG